MPCTRVLETSKLFSGGWEKDECNGLFGRIGTSRNTENNQKNVEIAHKNRRLSIHIMADMTNIDRENSKNNFVQGFPNDECFL